MAEDNIGIPSPGLARPTEEGASHFTSRKEQLGRQAILLMGPTGAGKTELALELARRYPVEIVSVDSAMVYRGLNIGTGKPDAATLRLTPHHLVDILDPSQPYSAGRFVRDARRLIDEIHARGRVPLLVGGTMLYFRSLTQGLAEMPSANAPIRAQLEAEAALKGWPGLHEELATIDPQAALRIQRNDAQRIQRALEVYRITGRTLSELHAAAPPPDSTLRFRRWVWSPAQRENLYARIERRFAAMLEEGLLEEVRVLHARKDLDAELPAIRSVGYRQLWAHLDGLYSLEEASRLAVLATRQLARRQLIWLRAASRGGTAAAVVTQGDLAEGVGAQGGPSKGIDAPRPATPGDPSPQWFDSSASGAGREIFAAVEKVVEDAVEQLCM